MTTFKTLENEIIPEGTKLPDIFLMIEDGKATLVEFTDGDCKFSPFSADLLAIVEGTFQAPQPEQAKPAVTYIATMTKYGKFYEVKVLASNGRSPIPVCSCTDPDEAQQKAESKYADLTWVLPNRFQQEVTCL